MSGDPVKVLFIGGFGRSGSTLLDNVLGQVEGFLSCGEISYLWDRGIEQDRLCSCKNAFSACPFWSRVVARAFAGTAAPDPAPLVAARESLTPKRVAVAAMGGLAARDLDGGGALLDCLEPVYRAIRDETGCRVIVDSSKAPGHGFLLRSSSAIDAYALHLVRDPRAVAYSWQKKMVYDPTGEEPMYMSRHSPLRSSRLWNTWNLATERVWRSLPERYERLRYEEFVGSPAASLRRIVDFVGERVEKLPVDASNRFEMGAIHALAGNPSRFEDGPIEIRSDDKWRRELPGWQRLLVRTLTLPLLLRYGYLRGR
ncbi:MAG: sulfotransferase [Acidobacteriota bacterium]|nr:sulfotransferase [Acidobacteriota bacterium]MDH3525046.1 sulfotransferase [Acidobacteriota bacterium]